MAIFNPQNPDINIPQGIGYQGYRYADKSAGGALNTLAAAIDTGAKTANYTIEKTGQQALNADVDKVQALYGVDAATIDPSKDPTLPPGLANGLGRLDTLTAGYQSGSIKDSHYLGQLQALVKQYKTNYPGYEDKVDEWMQAKAGITPANALVATLREEALRGLAGRNQLAKDRLDFEEANTDAITRSFGSDYFTDPSKRNMPMEQLMAGVGKVKAQDSDVASMKAGLEYKALQGKAQDTDYENYIKGAVGVYTNQYLNSGLGEQFQDQMKELQAAGHTPTPEVQAQMKQMFGQLKSNITSGITKEMSKPLADGKTVPWFQVSQQVRDDVLKSATGTIDAIGEDITNKDYGWAAIDGGVGKSITDKTMNRILGSSPTLDVFAAAKQFGGDALASMIIEHHLGEIDQSLLAATASKAVTGRGTIDGSQPTLGADFDAVSKANLSGDVKADPKLYKAVIDTNAGLLKDPTISPEVKGNVVRYMFTQDPKDFLKMFDTDKMSKVYSNMVGPQVTQSVLDAAKQSGDHTIWTNYSSWATHAFLAINQQVAGDLKNTPQEVKDSVTIKYNQSRGQLELIPTGKGLVPGEDPLQRIAATDLLRTKVQDLNAALSSFSPVANGDGLNMNAVGKDLIKSLGLPVSTNDDEKNKDSEKVLPTPQEKQELDTTDFLKFVSSAEGAGYNTMFGETKDNPKYNLTNMTVNEVMDLQKQQGGSGAAGALQIQRATLSYLKDKMGLSGNEFMTADLQNQMGQELMRRRGLADFQTGKISKEQYVNNLAQEWASLPTTSGKSYYEGDGVNHARVGLDDVMNNLNQMANKTNDNLSPNV